MFDTYNANQTLIGVTLIPVSRAKIPYHNNLQKSKKFFFANFANLWEQKNGRVITIIN